MATKIAAADGNFGTAGTWGDVATASSSLLDSEANNTALTTAYVESQALTPGAVTIDGIAVKVASRNAAPVGTISIRLAQAGALVAGTEVTINVSDIASRDLEQGWYFFKFAAPVLLVAATAYTVSAKTSNASMVNLFRNATAGNWSRMLRTTTTGAPAAGDNIFILGEYTAAATRTTRTVTMDSTATTDYCDGSAGNPPQFGIGNGGTLTWGTTAATNYILRLSGKLWIYVGGTMNMGTTGTPVPRDGSQELQFDCGADGDFGLVVYGTFNAQGQSRTAAKIFTKCLLNTDEAAAQTVLGVDTDTGWLNGDEVVIAATSRTASQAELRVLNGGAGASSITVTVGLTNAHSGTSPTQAEVILLTRNCRIVSVSSSFMAYFLAGAAAAVDCDWALFRYMGANVTGKRGVEINTTTGSSTFDYCCFREFDLFGYYVVGTTCANFFARNCVGYLVGQNLNTDAGFMVASAVTATTWEISDCVCIRATSGYGFFFNSLSGTVQRINGNSGNAGIGVNLSGLRIVGTCSHWTAHSNGTNGIELSGIIGGRITNLTAWRQNGGGQQGGLCFLTFIGELTLDTLSIFGNPVNIASNNALELCGQLLFRNATIAGDTTFSSANGWQYPSSTGGGSGQRVIFENCTMGVASGIFVAHTTSDVDFSASSPQFIQIVFRNTNLASTTEFTNKASLFGRSYIAYQKKDQVANDHQTEYPALGTIAREGTIFHTDAPSEKLTPNGATAALRLRSQIRRIPVSSGDAMAVSVWVRKSSLYAGSTVRLLALSNYPIGIVDDTVVDSMTAGADTWEQLTGTLPAATADGVIEICVEVDGSAGIVYVDDWAAAVA